MRGTLGHMAIRSGPQAPVVCLHLNPGLLPVPERAGNWHNGHARDAGLGIDPAVWTLLLPAGHLGKSARRSAPPAPHLHDGTALTRLWWLMVTRVLFGSGGLSISFVLAS